MVKTILKSGIAIVALALLLVGCSKQNPSEYNNQMMKIINASTEDMALMNDAMTAKDWAKAEEVRNTWQKKLEKSIETVEAQGDFNGDTSLKKRC